MLCVIDRYAAVNVNRNIDRSMFTDLGRVERGEINITLSTLEKIIGGLGMTEAEFFSSLDFESEDPTLVKLMREVKQSSKRDQYLNDYFLKTTLTGSLFLSPLSSSYQRA